MTDAAIAAAGVASQCRDPQMLCPCVRSRYLALLHEAEILHGMAVSLIETLRQPSRQAYYLRIGASRTMQSMHLAQPPHSLALAFDAIPTLYLSERSWHPEGPLWPVLGSIGESVGLEWGGRWTGFHDAPHFQLRECLCVPHP